jgi:hypothetical protein
MAGGAGTAECGITSRGDPLQNPAPALAAFTPPRVPTDPTALQTRDHRVTTRPERIFDAATPRTPRNLEVRGVAVRITGTGK